MNRDEKAMLLIPDPITKAIRHGVQERYNEPYRYYHTYQHALDVMANVERAHIGFGFKRPVEAALAALYHDICYRPGDRSNEDMSARAAMSDLSNFSLQIDVGRVCYLIWLTKFHFALRPYELSQDEDARMFMDCDIYGFAAPKSAFEEQNKLLEQEFSSLARDRQSYLRGRREFLQSTVENRWFFQSKYFSTFDTQAKLNVRSALEEIDRELGILA